jgi:CheY-like chemotaxis protein
MSKRCLLIDDDDDDRLIFESTVQKYFPGYQIRSFSSFEAAKAEVKPMKESNPSIIFMDLNMPKTNGLAALNMIRSNSLTQQLPVVIYSTSNNPDDINSCLKAGATAFITKPSTIAELVELIGDYLKN